jgi:sulfate transport system ATP-binding protein
MSIGVRNLRKRFGATVVCDDLDLDVPSGKLVALLGPSGSGKTTLLRIIAGLERPDSGRVLFEGRDATHEDVRDRKVGFVFQHYALFGHMTVFENVAFGLRVRSGTDRRSDAAIRRTVADRLKLVQLESLSDRYPHQLSGGQRQRVALARALAVEPKVLLLDEPFGALDSKVRKELRRWLRRLHADVQVTTVFVTHDQDEAMEIADRVVVMNRGRIEQDGPPDEVYDHPASPFVLQFLGNVNRFDGSRDVAAETPAAAAVSYVRPHELHIVEAPQDDALPVQLVEALNVGPLVRIEFIRTDDGSQVDVEMPRGDYTLLQERLGLQRGSRVWLKATRVTRFPADAAIPVGTALSAGTQIPAGAATPASATIPPAHPARLEPAAMS